MDTGLVVMIRAHNLTLEELARKLMETPLVQQTRIMDDHVAVSLAGKDDDAGNLLKYLVEQNIPISDFRQHKTQLEDLFLNITKGRLQ